MRCVPVNVQWTASCCSLGLDGKLWARWKHRHAHPPAATPGSTADSSLQEAGKPPPEQGSAHAPTVSTASDSDDALQKPTADTVSQTSKQLELIDLSGDTGQHGLPATDAASDKQSGQSSAGSTPQRFGRGSDAGISGGDNAGSSGSKNAEARPPTASSANKDRPSSQAQMAAPILTQPTELRASAKPFQPTVNHQPGGLLAPSRDQQPQSDSRHYQPPGQAHRRTWQYTYQQHSSRQPPQVSYSQQQVHTYPQQPCKQPQQVLHSQQERPSSSYVHSTQRPQQGLPHQNGTEMPLQRIPLWRPESQPLPEPVGDDIQQIEHNAWPQNLPCMHPQQEHCRQPGPQQSAVLQSWPHAVQEYLLWQQQQLQVQEYLLWQQQQLLQLQQQQQEQERARYSGGRQKKDRSK